MSLTRQQVQEQKRVMVSSRPTWGQFLAQERTDVWLKLQKAFLSYRSTQRNEREREGIVPVDIRVEDEWFVYLDRVVLKESTRRSDISAMNPRLSSSTMSQQGGVMNDATAVAPEPGSSAPEAPADDAGDEKYPSPLPAATVDASLTSGSSHQSPDAGPQPEALVNSDSSRSGQQRMQHERTQGSVSGGRLHEARADDASESHGIGRENKFAESVRAELDAMREAFLDFEDRLESLETLVGHSDLPDQLEGKENIEARLAHLTERVGKLERSE
jgi:hypothetical protein